MRLVSITPTHSSSQIHSPTSTRSKQTLRESNQYPVFVDCCPGLRLLHIVTRTMILLRACLLVPFAVSTLASRDETATRPNEFKKWRQETPPKVRTPGRSNQLRARLVLQSEYLLSRCWEFRPHQAPCVCCSGKMVRHGENTEREVFTEVFSARLSALSPA